MASWEKLLETSDAELKSSNEETIDEFYAFLLTNKLQSTSNIAQQPTHLLKLFSTLQTISRLKDAEFQELLSVYEQEQQQREGHGQTQLEHKIHEQEKKIQDLEIQLHRSGGREVLLLREEVDDLRKEVEKKQKDVESEQLQIQKLENDLSEKNLECQHQQSEISRLKDIAAGYQSKLERQQNGVQYGIVEEELRERLRSQEKEIAEQLDSMEELIKEKERIEQELNNMTMEVQLYQNKETELYNEIKKHQETLVEVNKVTSELQSVIQRNESDLAQLQDQLSLQVKANEQLCAKLKEDAQKYDFQLSSRSEELAQALEKISLLEKELRTFEKATKQGSLAKLSKDLSEKESDIQKLQNDLNQASKDIESLTKQLQDANRRADPHIVSPALYQEINELQSKCTELESILVNEKQRRQQSEKEKEQCDCELAEARTKIEKYERGEVGLKEAILEIKQKKEELAQRDSNIASLIQQLNKLQGAADTLYDRNEALRLRLGMSPDDNIDLTEIRKRREAELVALKEHNIHLMQEVEKLEEEKLNLRKKVVGQATRSKGGPLTSVTPKSPDHVTVADLKGQISQLKSALNTEKQRKESCQREIARLSKEVLLTSSNTPVLKTGQAGFAVLSDKDEQDEVDFGDKVLRIENEQLKNKLKSLSQQYQQLLNSLHQKETELLSLRNLYKQSSSIGSTPLHNDNVNDQLSLVIKELQEREQHLKDCQEQLEQYKRKFSVIIHQQGILYKEYQETKEYWERERDKLERDKQEMEIRHQQDQIKVEELKSLQDTLSNDPDTIKQKLSELSCAITVLKVNERVLTRRNTLLQSSDAKLRKELNQMKQEMSEMEMNISQQISYLKRHKDSASYKISSLQKQLSQCVPCSQLNEANAQYIEFVSKYHGLFQQQVCQENDHKDIEEKLRAMSEKIIQLQATETELRLNAADHLKISQLENEICTLELKKAKLEQANSQLKESLEATQVQLVSVQKRKDVESREIELLRNQIHELSTQSDQKTLIVQLQQQLSSAQLKEQETVSQMKSTKSRLLSLEAELLQLNQRNGEKEEEMIKTKAKYIDRIQKLTAVLQSHQRRYIGATLVPDQMKFSLLLSQAKKNKEQSDRELEEIQKERQKVETKVHELEVQQNNLQELLLSIKEGQDMVGKVTEWHCKLGEMRLKELEYRKSISTLERKLKQSQNTVASYEENISNLEHKLLQSNKDYEELLLSYGGEDSEIQIKARNVKDGVSVKEVVREKYVECNHLPVISQLQTELQLSHQKCHNLNTSLTGLETQLVAKDELIRELQLQINTIEKQKMLEEKKREVHSSHALEIATETIEQLQSQLTQKEGQLDKYQRLLQESRQELQMSIEAHKEEILLMERKLETKTNALSRLQTLPMSPPPPPIIPNSSTLSLDQVTHLHELEEQVTELRTNNKKLSDQLERERKERDKEKSRSFKKEEETRKEINEMKRKHQMDIKELQNKLATKSDQVTELEQELEILNGELSAALEANKKVPSRTLRELVDRLRTQLSEKEKQLQTLTESLKQVRADLVDTAQKTLQSHVRQDSVEANIHKLVIDKVREVQEKDDEKMREMRVHIAQVESELNDTKKKWKDICLEYERLQVDHHKKIKEYEERGSLLERQEGEIKQLKKSLNESRSKEQRLNKENVQLRESIPSSNQELEELRKRCEILQEKLERQRQQIHELESHRDSLEKSSSPLAAATSKAAPVSLIDTKHTSIEVARWEEGKKWQHKVETLKNKLSERNKELEMVQKQMVSLKEMLERMEREKNNLLDKVKSLEKSKAAATSAKPSSNISDEEVFALKDQIFKLQTQVATLQEELQKSNVSEVKQLRAENKLLNDALEKEMKGSSYEGIAMETKLRDELLQSKKAHTQLQFQFEQATLELPRLKSRVKDLEHYIEVLKSSAQAGSNSRQSSKSGVYTASEVEKVVCAMKKVIEKLQGENEALKAKEKKLQRGSYEAENKRLKSELEKSHKSLAALSGTSGSGQPSLAANAISENDKLRNELKKEIEKSEKLYVSLSKLKSEKTKLEEQLTKFSEPHESLIKERDRYKKENIKLKAELDSFDPQFFEEIEDLKYNYQVSVQKNIEYEEQLKQYSIQYGFQLPQLNDSN